VKILVADDHAIVRAGIKQILTSINDISIIDEASEGSEVLKKASSEYYDIIVLDISLPDMNGLDILKKLKVEQPDLHVLILSIHSEEQYAVRVLKAGASGYLTKASAPEELIKAIMKIVGGEKYVSEALAEKLAKNLEGKSKNLPHELLSDREFQIMRMIAQGKTIKEIAGELFISDKTVSTYRARLLLKMGMKNNSELTHYVTINGLLE
jgi:DNA-binding NarL/FixJ family response regulator